MINPLARFFEKLSSTNDSAIGIDIGSAYLKVVQLRRKRGKAILETYGELALGPYAGFDIGRATHLPPDTLAEALVDLLREAHVTTREAGIAIPFASSLVTVMNMPPLEPKELSVAVPIEARKYVPVPMSEVNLDWWIIPDAPAEETSVPAGQEAEKNPPKNVQVLISAIHKDAMSRFERIATGASVVPGFYEIEIFSTVRALFPQDMLAHAVLDMGAAEMKLYIIDKGLLRFSHIINRGAQELTIALSKAQNIGIEEAEKQKRQFGLSGSATAPTLKGILDYTFAEVNQAIDSYGRRFGGGVSDLILSGGGANLPGIGEFAASSCEVPVSRANPFAQVEAPAFLEDVLRAVGPEFSVALGAAFRKLQEMS